MDVFENDCHDEPAEGGMGSFLFRRLLKSRTLLIYEAVSDALSRRVQTQLLLLQEDDPKAPVTVYINSPGGSADDGFAIYDALRFFRPPVRTVVSGICASAAVKIYLAAPKERRFALPNSRFMVHQPWTAMRGTASDIKIEAEEIQKLKQRYFQLIATECGRPLEKVVKDADRDFWLTSTEAKEYGLVGKIVTSAAELG